MLKHKQKTCEHAGKAHTSSTRKKHRYLIGPRPRETVSERVEQENKKARRNERVKNKQKTCEHASKAHPQRKKRAYLIIGGRARLYFSGRRKTPTAIWWNQNQPFHCCTERKEKKKKTEINDSWEKMYRQVFFTKPFSTINKREKKVSLQLWFPKKFLPEPPWCSF